MRRITVLLSALIVLSFLLPSCGDGSAGSGEKPTPPDNQSADLPDGGSSLPSQSGDSTEETEKPDEYAAMKQLSYYDESLFDRYVAYKKTNTQLTDAQVVTHVNIGLDYPYYNDEIISPAENLGTNLISLL